MADITKCLNDGCPVRNKCYRFTAPSNEYAQAVSMFDYKVVERKVHCDHFWLNSSDKKDNDLTKVFDGRGYKI